LERPNTCIRFRTRIFHSVRIGQQKQTECEKRKRRFFPEPVHHEPAHQRQVVQFALLGQRNGPAQRVRAQLHVSVGEKEPFARGCFVSLLKRMRLSEPAGRQFVYSNEPKVRVFRGNLRKIRDVESVERSSAATISKSG